MRNKYRLNVRMAVLGAALLILSGAVQAQLFQDATSLFPTPLTHGGNYMITGQGFADLNNDGHLDIVVTSSQGPSFVLLGSAGDYQMATQFNAAISASDRSGGVAMADYDNDGDTDLFIANYGQDRLYRNEAGNSFTEVAISAGIDYTGRSESAAWGDLNGDGWLDLVIGSFPLPPEENDNPNDYVHLDRLYLNNRDGTFSDITASFGDPSRLHGYAFAVTFFDYDNDGDQDIYFANDKKWGNLLYRNDGPGCPGGWCLTDVSVATSADRPVDGMGITWADYDHDGDFDVFVSGLWEMVLLESQIAKGQHAFIEVTEAAGVNYDAVG